MSEHDDPVTSPRLRVMIVIASKHGSTIALAGAMAQEMSAQGATVVVAEPDDDVDLDAHDAVVVGARSTSGAG